MALVYTIILTETAHDSAINEVQSLLNDLSKYRGIHVRSLETEIVCEGEPSTIERPYSSQTNMKIKGAGY